MPLRFATWSAVSTKSQSSADKISLEIQRQHCHAAAQTHGWQHVRDYVIPGQTRTRWISLRDAEQHLPPLREMLDAAARNEFDILVVYDLNRFRDLMRPVYDVLCDCNVQLYILSDPREPVPPSQYTEERKNEIGLTVGLRDIISRQEISTLQKHYRDKMPARVTVRGLHPGLGRPPYGYQKPPGREHDRAAILQPLPQQAQVIHQIKTWFLENGMSLTAIADRLNAQNIPSPRGKRWWYTVVAYILANPFYAGVVSFGSTRRQRIRRTGQVQRHRATPVSAPGRHTPLWDQATHERILAELERRGQSHPGLKTRQLSRLLYCWCGAVMWAQATPAGLSWRCSSLQPKHAHIQNAAALQIVADELTNALAHLDDLDLPAPHDPRPNLRAELEDLRARRKRWLDAYELGSLDAPTLTDRIRDLDSRITRTIGLLHDAEADHTRSLASRQTLRDLAAVLDTIPAYLQQAPPAQVNAHLRRLLRRIHLHPNKTITLEFL